MASYAPVSLPGDGAPDGAPEARCIHWTPARKAEVLRRVADGEMTVGRALSRYALTLEEFEAWRAAHKRAGQGGLRVTQPAPAPTQGRLL